MPRYVFIVVYVLLVVNNSDSEHGGREIPRVNRTRAKNCTKDCSRRIKSHEESSNAREMGCGRSGDCTAKGRGSKKGESTAHRWPRGSHGRQKDSPRLTRPPKARRSRSTFARAKHDGGKRAKLKPTQNPSGSAPWPARAWRTPVCVLKHSIKIHFQATKMHAIIHDHCTKEEKRHRTCRTTNQ